MMFQLWASVIDRRTRNTKLSTSSRGASSGRKARRPSARRMLTVQARSVLSPERLILSALRGMTLLGGSASSRKRSSGALEQALRPEYEDDQEDDEVDHLAVGLAEG